MYVVPPDSAFSKEAEGAADEVELLRGDGQRGLQLISLCDLADMMAEQAPGRIRPTASLFEVELYIYNMQ